VTWATSVPVSVFLGLSVLDYKPDVCGRQTDVRQKNRFIPPPTRGGGIINTGTELLKHERQAKTDLLYRKVSQLTNRKRKRQSLC